MSIRPSQYELPALPRSAVRDIWMQAGYETPPEHSEYSQKGPNAQNEKLLEFVRIAILPPHYARSVDIAHALDVTESKARLAVNRTIFSARKARDYD